MNKVERSKKPRKFQNNKNELQTNGRIKQEANKSNNSNTNSDDGSRGSASVGGRGSAVAGMYSQTGIIREGGGACAGSTRGTT